MSSAILIILIVLLVAGLAILEWQLIKLRRFYHFFFDKTDPKAIQNELKKYSKDVAEALSKLDELATFSAHLHQKSLEAISKVGLVRFNPFNDTGGDQSFCLALLDRQNTGLVISSIHARSGTRFYAKEIIKGQASSNLSDEEALVLKKAVGRLASAEKLK